jgi:hypothetical protein
MSSRTSGPAGLLAIVAALAIPACAGEDSEPRPTCPPNVAFWHLLDSTPTARGRLHIQPARASCIIDCHLKEPIAAGETMTLVVEVANPRCNDPDRRASVGASAPERLRVDAKSWDRDGPIAEEDGYPESSIYEVDVTALNPGPVDLVVIRSDGVEIDRFAWAVVTPSPPAGARLQGSSPSPRDPIVSRPPTRPAL